MGRSDAPSMQASAHHPFRMTGSRAGRTDRWAGGSSGMDDPHGLATEQGRGHGDQAAGPGHCGRFRRLGGAGDRHDQARRPVEERAETSTSPAGTPTGRRTAVGDRSARCGRDLVAAPTHAQRPRTRGGRAKCRTAQHGADAAAEAGARSAATATATRVRSRSCSGGGRRSGQPGALAPGRARRRPRGCSTRRTRCPPGRRARPTCSPASGRRRRASLRALRSGVPPRRGRPAPGRCAAGS